MRFILSCDFMPRMQIFLTEKVPKSLRGLLTRWMLELRPGVFIGTLSTLVGEKLWDSIQKKLKHGGALWIRATNTEQKFEIKSFGNYDRILRDFDGMLLVTLPPKINANQEIEEDAINSAPSETDNSKNNLDDEQNPDDEIENPFETLEFDEKINQLSQNPQASTRIETSALSCAQKTDDLAEKKVDIKLNIPEKIIQEKAPTQSNQNKNVNQPHPKWETNSSSSLNKNNKPKKKIYIKQESAPPPPLSWDPNGVPLNFIVRSAKYFIEDNQLKSHYEAKSAYWEFPPESVWDSKWIADIEQTVTLILRQHAILLQSTAFQQNITHHHTIVSLDIETTNYIPKAYEGFVNILGLAILTLPSQDSSQKSLQLELFQVFNMTRKKELAPILLRLAEPKLKNIDHLLVFNENFDIKILSAIINEHKLPIQWPAKIIDLQKSFQSLKLLEKSLTDQISFKRNQSAKGKYEEYYLQFKGNGPQGNHKQIEPIGNYNLMDCLSPLLMYLLSLSKN